MSIPFLSKTLVLFTSLSLPLFAAEKQYYSIPDFMGGLNTSKVGDIQPNQSAVLNNFLFDRGELRVRRGNKTVSDNFHTQPVTFLGIYATQAGTKKIILQSGARLYIASMDVDTILSDNEYTSTIFSIDTLAIADGTSANDSASYYIATPDSTSPFEGYRAYSVELESIGNGNVTRTYVVNYVVNDSLILLTTPLSENVHGWRLRFPTNIGTVVFGRTFVDTFYLATSMGIMRYNNTTLISPDVPNVQKFRGTYDELYIWNNMPYATTPTFIGGWYRDKMMYVRIGAQASGKEKYVKLSLRPQGTSSSALNGQVYYSTLRVLGGACESSGGSNCGVVTAGGAFLLDVSAANRLPFIQLLNMDVDYASKRTLVADSLILAGDTANGFYTKVVCDTCAFDSLSFASGDWFMCEGNVIVDDPPSQYTSVIGNYVDDSSRVFVTHRNYLASGVSVRTGVQVSFYRRRVHVESQDGIIAAAIWNDQFCVVRDSASSRVDISDAFAPETFSGYYVDINPDDGEPIIWLKPMYGNLLIGKRSSIWKLTGVFGLDAFAQLSKSVEGISFVAPKSIVEHNGLIFGLAADGFYFYDFNSMVKISDNIDEIVRDSINWNYASGIVAEYWDGHFWVSYPSRKSVVNDRVLVYSPTYQAWGSADIPFASIVIDRTDNDTANTYWGSPTTGLIKLYGAWYQDDGDAISATLRTRWFDFGSSFIEKIIDRVGITYYLFTQGQITASIYKDGATIAYASDLMTSTNPTTKRLMSRLWLIPDLSRGYEYQLGIVIDNATNAKIGKAEIEYEVESTDY